MALGALADAGLSLQDVDGFFCGADAPGLGGMTMAAYIGLNRLRHLDSTETGGSSYLLHVSHAAQAIAAGHCNIALVTLADCPLSAGIGTGLSGVDTSRMPDRPFMAAVPPVPLYGYAMVARRHMHEFGTTSEQLAWVKVAASHHAQHNPNALLRKVLTVDDVLSSPMVADPLHRLDCCVMTDGGGAVVVTRPEIARDLRKPVVKLLGAGEALKHSHGGRIDLTWSAGVHSGAKAFEEAGIKPSDIQYASLYDSFTITVVMQLEDLGCPRRGRALRRGRQPDLRCRQAAVPARRRTVQQPRQQGRRRRCRGRAAVPRRGHPRGCPTANWCWPTAPRLAGHLSRRRTLILVGSP